MGGRGGVLVGEGECICSHGRTAARGPTKTGNEEQGNTEGKREGGGERVREERRDATKKEEKTKSEIEVRTTSDTVG